MQFFVLYYLLNKYSKEYKLMSNFIRVTTKGLFDECGKTTETMCGKTLQFQRSTVGCFALFAQKYRIKYLDIIMSTTPGTMYTIGDVISQKQGDNVWCHCEGSEWVSMGKRDLDLSDFVVEYCVYNLTQNATLRKKLGIKKRPLIIGAVLKAFNRVR